MDDKRYTLMNKNRPVLDFLYNLDTHHVVKILKRRELDFAPPDFLDSEVADMKDASAKLLCDSNSGQPSKNLHTEH